MALDLQTLFSADRQLLAHAFLHAQHEHVATVLHDVSIVAASGHSGGSAAGGGGGGRVYGVKKMKLMKMMYTFIARDSINLSNNNDHF